MHGIIADYNLTAVIDMSSLAACSCHVGDGSQILITDQGFNPGMRRYAYGDMRDDIHHGKKGQHHGCASL